jgi:hypothetical protein
VDILKPVAQLAQTLGAEQKEQFGMVQNETQELLTTTHPVMQLAQVLLLAVQLIQLAIPQLM